jgi:hypothetical protein
MLPAGIRLLVCSGAAAAVLASLPPDAAAQTACETLRSRIERNIRDNGVVDARVVVADRGNAPPGRVVGDCDGGRRVLIYRRDGVELPAAPASRVGASAKGAPVITECADGSQPADGRCPPARR